MVIFHGKMLVHQSVVGGVNVNRSADVVFMLVFNDSSLGFDGFSRMRSEGFLFSFLGVWGWWTVCGSFSCRGAKNRVLAVSMGKVRKGDVLRRGRVHFVWQAWGFVARKRKLLRGSLMFTSPLSMGKVRKMMCCDV